MGLRDIAIATYMRAIAAPSIGDALFERQVAFAEANPEISERRGHAACARPPRGWWCSLGAGHAGACATHRSDLSL